MRAVPDLSVAQWRKSSYSSQEENTLCVEVAHNFPTLIPVRDSKTPHSTPLTFTPHAWQTFITATSSR
ncbi:MULTISPECIES: DUF397 domain-containing protein [unclassified Streptomyces]|uniref:DUF397 domain-containing protein n=1 Tax=unclassified Streptomyces TaxID=2593676 RepID=UPI000DD5A0EE|nr:MULTISPECIES: DUF397 domain-containing protein [unclassified Streptomyces]QZZ27913.1 DUF397 domain-containing protein [Streptomyces sp. ST1015]